MADNQIVVKISAENMDFLRKVQECIQAINKQDKAIRDMSKGGREIKPPILNTSGIAAMTQTLARIEQQAGRAQNTLAKIQVPTINSGTSKSGSGILGMLSQVTIVGAGAFAMLSQIKDVAASILMPGFNFARSMETNEIGIAGILSSMTTLNGKNLEWNQAISVSKNLMRQLSDEALRTNATTEELTTTFRALLGPGLGAGMKVNEIIKLSSIGATAVKSLGLNGTQLVQELRDLVQGGIQPASSTLATALGLKDKDIKAARASSEGLFKFLMDRLSGFAMAGEASKKSMDGIIDQIKEGTQRISAEGTAPIYGAVKAELAEVANSLVYLNAETKKVELNPQLVNDLTYASKKAVEIGKNIAEMARPIGEVAIPALQMFGDAIVYIGENIKVITVGLTSWMVLGKISLIYKDVVLAANGAAVANTMLGRAVLAVRNSYTLQALAAREAAAQEMQSAMQATATIDAARSQRILAAENEHIITQGILKAEQVGWGLVAAQIRGLQAEYMKLGATAEQAGAMQLQAAKAAQSGQIILAQQIMATQRAHLASAATSEASAAAAVSGAGRAASAVKTFTAAVWALVGGWAGVAAAIGYALYALVEYNNTKWKVESYDKKAEVRFNPETQTYQKKKWVERNPSREEIFASGFTGQPTESGWEWGDLSGGELEEHKKFEKIQNGEWAKEQAAEQERKMQEMAEEANKLRNKYGPSDDDAQKKALKESQEKMKLDIKDAELFYKAKINELKAAKEALEKSHLDSDNLKEYTKKLAQAERNIVDAEIAKVTTKIDIVSGTDYKNENEKALEIKELNAELAELARKAQDVGTALGEVAQIAKVSGDDIIGAAEKKLDTPYVLGADGVSATDCGKYVQDVWNQVGLEWSSRYVPYMIDEAKKKGLWREAGSGYTPKKGDGMVVLGDNHVGMSDGDGGIYHASFGRKRTVHDPDAQAAFGTPTGFIAVSELTKQGDRQKIVTQDLSKKFKEEYLKMIDEGNKILEEAAKYAGDISTKQKENTEKYYDVLIEKFKNNGQSGFAAAAEKVKNAKLAEFDFAQVQKDLETANAELTESQTQLFAKVATGTKSVAEASTEYVKLYDDQFAGILAELEKQLAAAGDNDDLKRSIKAQMKQIQTTLKAGFEALLQSIDEDLQRKIAQINANPNMTNMQREDAIDEATRASYLEQNNVYRGQVNSLRSREGDNSTEIIRLENLIAINTELAKTPSLIDKLHIAGKQGLEDGFNTFFDNLMTGCKGVGQSFQDLANSILQSISKVIANRLTQQFMGMLFPTKTDSGRPSIGGGSLSGPLLGDGGFFSKFATGGDIDGGGKVSGPGTGISDSILAWSSRFKKFIGIGDGEYVIRAAAVKKLGTQFFDYVNSGMIPPEIYNVHERYASGGSLAASSAGNGAASYAAGDNIVSVPVTVNGASSPAMASDLRNGIEELVIQLLKKYS